MKVGSIYLMVDPGQNSSAPVDIRRIWLERVPVRLIKRRLFSFGHKRYLIQTEDGKKYYTGRLERSRREVI
jgi:hypothetical protein